MKKGQIISNLKTEVFIYCLFKSKFSFIVYTIRC